MTIYIALLLTVLTVVGVIGVVKVSRLTRSVEENTAETRALRLTSRTRIRKASMQSGATSSEQKLTRLGRASAARRVVVGGDSDSQLHHDMNRSLRQEEDNG